VKVERMEWREVSAAIFALEEGRANLHVKRSSSKFNQGSDLQTAWQRLSDLVPSNQHARMASSINNNTLIDQMKATKFILYCDIAEKSTSSSSAQYPAA
jgi:tetrahydromethanopterin S-methyltransferase subunit H